MTARRRTGGVARRPKTSFENAATWDTEYAAGEWNHLDSPEEIAHYMVILGYLTLAPDEPAILDLGCGHGRLLKLLNYGPFGEYLGVDFSEEAVRRAKALAVPGANFEVADIEYWEPASRFDAIVFNEVLYYARRPRSLLNRALGWLGGGGIVVVSMFQYDPRASRMWTVLDACDVEVLGETTVTDARSGYAWDVRAVRPMRPS
jgi:2-polyprenyl-6-hydroxyphenyl methylase/3-demethylubiquinone-9 3-methyltransferase